MFTEITIKIPMAGEGGVVSAVRTIGEGEVAEPPSLDDLEERGEGAGPVSCPPEPLDETSEHELLSVPSVEEPAEPMEGEVPAPPSIAESGSA
ncbi:MAG: hypothetical protein JSV99_10365 [Planctomycetota bacterium]|nr:MAG: hypothetical protein JSV99_10365 [Planctomycetota bacterium]